MRGGRKGWRMEEEPPCYRLQMQPCCQHLAQGTGAQPLHLRYNVRLKSSGMQQKCTDGGCIVCNSAGQGEIQLKPWLQLKPTKYTPLLYHTAQNTDSLMFDHFTVLNPTLQQLPALNSARCCRRQHGDVRLESN